MLKFIFLMLLLGIFSCNSDVGKILFLESTQSNLSIDSTIKVQSTEIDSLSNKASTIVNYDTIYSEEPIKDSIKLFFESAFKKDQIFIKINDKKMYSDIISTDHTIGLAKVYTIEKGRISLKINDSDFVEIPYANSNYVRIQFLNNQLKIIITNNKPRYK